MIYRKRESLLSRMAAPLMCLLLIAGLFGLIKLRSSFISLEYRIGDLDKQRAEAYTQRKDLEAGMASILSIKEVGDRQIALAFPDRKKVVYVKRDSGGVPYSASASGGLR